MKIKVSSVYEFEYLSLIVYWYTIDSDHYANT